MTFEQVPGYNQLDAGQQGRLSIVYAQHMTELNHPEDYKLANIQRVEWNNETHDVGIYFLNGDSYHYTMHGTWY